MARYMVLNVNSRVARAPIFPEERAVAGQQMQAGQPSGQHGAKSRVSEYGVQLREKQKIRRIYGVLERQFRSTSLEAARRKGFHWRKPAAIAGIAPGQRGLSHGFRLDPRRIASAGQPQGHRGERSSAVNIPSFPVSNRRRVTVREKSRSSSRIPKPLVCAGPNGIGMVFKVHRRKKMEGVNVKNVAGTLRSVQRYRRTACCRVLLRQ